MNNKNINKLKKETAIIELIRFVLILLVVPSFIVIGIVAPQSNIGATIVFIIAIINLIAIKILKMNIESNKDKIYKINIITKAIDDRK